MSLNAIVPVFIFILFSFSGKAQRCTLDIGGTSSETIVSVFQLSEAQRTKLETLGGALKIENKATEDAIQKLFDTHPQSSPEELNTMAGKYQVLQDKMIAASLAADTKLLSTFNERQYDRYLMLCDEAFRTPIKVVPMRIEDTVSDPS